MSQLGSPHSCAMYIVSLIVISGLDCQCFNSIILHVSVSCVLSILGQKRKITMPTLYILLYSLTLNVHIQRNVSCNCSFDFQAHNLIQNSNQRHNHSHQQNLCHSIYNILIDYITKDLWGSLGDARLHYYAHPGLWSQPSNVTAHCSRTVLAAPTPEVVQREQDT